MLKQLPFLGLRTVLIGFCLSESLDLSILALLTDYIIVPESTSFVIRVPVSSILTPTWPLLCPSMNLTSRR